MQISLIYIQLDIIFFELPFPFMTSYMDWMMLLNMRITLP